MAVKRGSVPMILLLRAAGAQTTPKVPCLEKWLQIEAHADDVYHFISQLKLMGIRRVHGHLMQRA